MLIDLTQPFAGEELVHRVLGEVDVASAPELRTALGRSMASSDGPVVVDLSAMSFIDAAGLGVLVWFAGAMRSLGRRATIRGANPMTTSLLALCGIDVGSPGTELEFAL